MPARGASIFLSVVISFFILSCSEQTDSPTANRQDDSQSIQSLPYLGIPDIEFRKDNDGSIVTDTIPYVIPKFSFINQDEKEISHRDYAGHIYVVDYFFTSCPSICPAMSSQLARLQGLLQEEKVWGDVKILSHTVDPDRDTPKKLKEYGERLGADFNSWNFVTGTKEDLYFQAQEGYFLTAFPSDTADGGFFHSDQVILIDRYFHIRGSYDGTSTKSVDQLFSDIKTLLNEQPANTVE